MGSILSRRIAGVEDIDIQANSAYRYPPKSGNYFASHFFMGGEKFDTPHPEGYLFGENMDLNFLGNRPVQFPYVTPAPHEPVKTLRSLVNIRKDSLRLVRYKDDTDSPTEDGEKPRILYSLEFTFDADARVAITIYCQAVEEFLNGMAVYSPKSPSLQSETVHYKRGVSQQFSLPSFKIDFSEWKDDELNFDLDRGMFPVVIQAVVDEGDVLEVTGHAHVLLAAFEKHMDGSLSVKPLKQKQIVDRVSYLLQEIYGIENKNNQETKVQSTWQGKQGGAEEAEEREGKACTSYPPLTDLPLVSRGLEFRNLPKQLDSEPQVHAPFIYLPLVFLSQGLPVSPANLELTM